MARAARHHDNDGVHQPRDVNVDTSGGDGGSTASFGGAANYGTTNIGNGPERLDTVSATGFANNGVLMIQGNTTGGTTNQAALIISGAAPGTWSGALRVSGDALLQFGSGALTGIGTGSSLELDGAQARILTSGGSASGLGGWPIITGPCCCAAPAAMARAARRSRRRRRSPTTGVNVDYYGGDGGSTANFGGVFANYGTTNIGNGSLSASTTVSATGLANNGVLTIQGNTTGGTTKQAALTISGAAPGRGRARCASPATASFNSAAACSPRVGPVPRSSWTAPRRGS